MSQEAGTLEAGSRYDLRVGQSPDAPDEADFRDDSGVFGYAHSYESSSRYDGPGVRVVLFLSGCLLRMSKKAGSTPSGEIVILPGLTPRILTSS